MQRTYHVCEDCHPVHIDNCQSCFGWGIKRIGDIPIAAEEIKDINPDETVACPECGGTLKNEHLYGLKRKSYLKKLDSRRIKAQPGSRYGDAIMQKALSWWVDKHSNQTTITALDGKSVHSWTAKN